MVGAPMPPVPDEPRYTQRQDECQAWDECGLDLGEGTPEAEHIAAMRAAVDIARLLQGGMMGDEAEGIKVGMFGPHFDAVLSRHIGLDGIGRVFMAADEIEHIDPEELDDFDDLSDATVLVHFDLGAMLFGISLPNGGERYQVVTLNDTLREAMQNRQKEE